MKRDAIAQTTSRPFEGGYGGYVVKFMPQPTPDGQFLAFTIVSCGVDALHTLAAVTPDLPSFATQAAAGSAGWEAATEWIGRNASGQYAAAAARTPSFVLFTRGAR